MKFFNALGNSFERLLRWFYPGILFLVLLFISKPNAWDSYWKFVQYNEVVGLWGLFSLVIVSGLLIYTIQAYFINNIVSSVSCLSGIGHRDIEQLRWGIRHIARGSLRWGETAWRRWGFVSTDIIREDRDRLGRWIDYSWGTYHVGCMTIWLYWFFYWFIDKDNNLNCIPLWIPVVISVFMGIFLVFHYIMLTRFALRIPNPHKYRLN